VFARIGYEIDHQTGSPITLRKSEAPHRRLTIPNHKQLAKGTLRGLIREAGISVEEFRTVL
jgi:predicted RNA binding protein YcfA (HicA-like mRNA interferase family)